jgi:hypothetical protein
MITIFGLASGWRDAAASGVALAILSERYQEPQNAIAKESYPGGVDQSRHDDT